MSRCRSPRTVDTLVLGSCSCCDSIALSEDSNLFTRESLGYQCIYCRRHTVLRLPISGQSTLHQP